MPIEKVSRSDAIWRDVFHQRLRLWLAMNEPCINPDFEYGGSGWVFVRDGDDLFKLNSDTPRDAVESYLSLVDVLGDDLDWHIVENKRGNPTGVAFGPQKIRPTSFYFYFVDEI